MKDRVIYGVLFLLCLGVTMPAFAQLKVAYVNSDRIMQEYEKAREAQQQLDAEAKKLEQQYQGMVAEYDSLSRQFQQQQYVMSEERRKQKQRELQQLQQQIQQFQMENVGPKGQIYAKQEEILGPVLDEINRAIREVASSGQYDFVFDSVGGNLLYAEEKHNITADVLYELRRGGTSSPQSQGQGNQ